MVWPLNKAEFWKVVRDEFPYAEIVESPGADRGFVVRDRDGSIWWVECSSPYVAKVSVKVILLHPLMSDSGQE